MCDSSVDSAFRNFRRAGMLKNRSRTVIAVPERQSGLFDRQHLAAGNLDDRSGRVFRGVRLQPQPAHRRDGRQRLAAKAQSRNVQQVVGVANLRGGVALEGQHGVVAHHAAAVVGHLDELLAAGLNVDADAARARIQRVLQQLLDHRRRTLHHLAGGDLVGYIFGENVDAAHGSYNSSHKSLCIRARLQPCRNSADEEPGL